VIKLKKIFIVSALFVFLLNTFVYADFDNVLKEKYIVEYKYGDYIRWINTYTKNIWY